MPWLALIPAAIAVGQAINDQANQNKEQKINSIATQYSPWVSRAPVVPLSNPGATLASGSGSALSTYSQLADAQRKAQQQAESLTPLTPLDAGTEGFLNNPDNTGSQYKLPQRQANQTQQPDGVHTLVEGQSPYGATQYLPPDEAAKVMGINNGQYQGMNPNTLGINWSPYVG